VLCERLAVRIVGAFKLGAVVRVIVDLAAGVRRAVEAVVAERAAVRQQEHQQPVVVDRAHADQLAAIEDLLLLAVGHAVDPDVGQPRQPRRPRGIPRIGEGFRTRVGAQEVGGAR
jgi:hypothetical protein